MGLAHLLLLVSGPTARELDLKADFLFGLSRDWQSWILFLAFRIVGTIQNAARGGHA